MPLVKIEGKKILKCAIFHKESVAYYQLFSVDRGRLLLNHTVFGGIEGIFLSLKIIVQLYFYEKIKYLHQKYLKLSVSQY